MLRKPKRFVEEVRLFSFQIAGKRHLVATVQATLFQGMLHHGAPHAVSLVHWTNGNSLHNASFLTTLSHGVQDHQFVGACDNFANHGHKNPEGWIAPDDSKVRDSLLNSETHRAVNSSIAVKGEDRRNILFSRCANGKIVHPRILEASAQYSQFLACVNVPPEGNAVARGSWCLGRPGVSSPCDDNGIVGAPGIWFILIYRFSVTEFRS